MARTESKSFQVHPDDEQEQINLMQKFHWSLLNSQTIDKVDNHLEQRGDSVYSVTNSEKYVKLTFSRDLDLPNLNELKQLEQDYFGLPVPQYPSSIFPFPSFIPIPGVLFWLVFAVFTLGIGAVIWLLYFFKSYKPKKAEAERVSQSNYEKRQQIMTEVAKYN
jgi:hypothetical protein